MLCIDHSSLRWLDSFHDKATDILTRWFWPYMTILYRPGKLHCNADALSRIDTRPCPREDCPDYGHLIKKVKSPSEKKPRLLQAIQTRGQGGDGELDTDLVPSLSNEEIRVSQKLNPELCRFMELLHKHAVKPNSKSLRQEPPDIKILCSLWYEFRVRDEILFRADKEVTDEWRLVIHRDKRKEILSLLHSSTTEGHPGMSRMKLTVCSRFYWPRMRNDIENWIKCCRSCTMAKRGPRRQCAPLQQEISGSPFDCVAFDVIGPLPTTANGNRFILTVIDYFSKWAEAYALPNHKAEIVADCIVKRWIAHHGIPVRIHSDNAPEFRGHVITQLKKMLCMKGTFTTPYRPQSNGLCECMNQTIENIIKCTVRED